MFTSKYFFVQKLSEPRQKTNNWVPSLSNIMKYVIICRFFLCTRTGLGFCDFFHLFPHPNVYKNKVIPINYNPALSLLNLLEAELFNLTRPRHLTFSVNVTLIIPIGVDLFS